MIPGKDSSRAIEIVKDLFKEYPNNDRESLNSIMNVLCISTAHAIFNCVNEDDHENLLNAFSDNTKLCLDHIREKYMEEHEQ